jgi:hypothetical protein
LSQHEDQFYIARVASQNLATDQRFTFSLSKIENAEKFKKKKKDSMSLLE